MRNSDFIKEIHPMTKSVFTCAAIATLAAGCSLGFAPPSPPASTSVTIEGKSISIKYSAPSVRGRKVFGEGGLISHDKTYPVWRAGANAATALHTDADLDIHGLHVPAGDYTLFVDVADPDHWELIVSKATGEWGLAYKKEMDLGRVKMEMSKPPSPVEVFKITLSSSGSKSGRLQMEWENHVASVPFHVK
ncbi:MAG TPA: DUF2911 domain-containing protein [Bryobacteraceae bacterium]|nr:DUF2911 domain-containing protein [Bryobacteraceae bacterium]